VLRGGNTPLTPYPAKKNPAICDIPAPSYLTYGVMVLDFILTRTKERSAKMTQTDRHLLAQAGLARMELAHATAHLWQWTGRVTADGQHVMGCQLCAARKTERW
jgi:hypothetical protein